MVGEIIKRFEANGFKLIAMKHIYATKEQLEVRNKEDKSIFKDINFPEPLFGFER
jgi:nucleoside diphosphate kinase